MFQGNRGILLRSDSQGETKKLNQTFLSNDCNLLSESDLLGYVFRGHDTGRYKSLIYEMNDKFI